MPTVKCPKRVRIVSETLTAPQTPNGHIGHPNGHYPPTRNPDLPALRTQRTHRTPLNSQQRRLLPDVLDELIDGGLVTRHETYNGNGEPTAEFRAAPM